MKNYWAVVISMAIITSQTVYFLLNASCCEIVSFTLPESIKIGVFTASYQKEDAWHTRERMFGIDRTHNNPLLVEDGSNGDAACNSYYKFEQDVRSTKGLGFDFYRSSISWPRALPSGFRNVISRNGIQYHKNLISEMLAEDLCTTRCNIISLGSPAKLGPSVRIFSTIKEPKVFCQQGYNGISHAPGKELYNLGMYLCGHNVLKAHAKIYHMYDEEFQNSNPGIECYYSYLKEMLIACQ